MARRQRDPDELDAKVEVLRDLIVQALGRRLLRYRTRRKLRQEKAAEAINLSYKHYQRFEQAIRKKAKWNPSLETVLKVVVATRWGLIKWPRGGRKAPR